MFVPPVAPYWPSSRKRTGARACPRPPRSCQQTIRVADRLAKVFGDESDSYARWCAAKKVATYSKLSTADNTELTYGEVDIHLIHSSLRLAGVNDGAHLVDIGSGYGRAILAAALLFPQLDKLTGIEVLRPLHQGAIEYEKLLRSSPIGNAEIRWLCDDYRGEKAQEVLESADLALCFATTWGDLSTLKLYELSRILANKMAEGSRAVIVDKELCASDGWSLLNQFDCMNRDTAESTVSVYKLCG